MAKEVLKIQTDKNKINDDVKKAASTWMRMSTLRGADRKGGFVDEAATNRMIVDMIQTYWDSIIGWCNLPREDRDDSLEVMGFMHAIVDEQKLADQESDEELTAAISEKVKKIGGSNSALEANEIESKTELSAEQKSGLREVAKWLYRNALRGGNFDWMKNIVHWANGDLTRNTSFDRRAYVQQIMEKSDQEKLLIYYLIANRKTNGAKVLPEDVEESQKYVPDLDAIKNRLIATRFKFWKRFLGSEIYWEKLGTAAQLATENRMILIGYLSNPQVDTEKTAETEAKAEMDEENREIEKDVSSGDMDTDMEKISPTQEKEMEKEKEEGPEGDSSNDEKGPSLDFEKIREAGEQRNAALKEFHEQLKVYKELITKQDDLAEGTEEYEKNEEAIRTQGTAIQENLAVLLEANSKLPKPEELEKAIDESVASVSRNKGNNIARLDRGENKLAAKSALASTIVKGVGGSGLGALTNLTKFVQINLSGVATINFLSGGLGALGGVANLLNIVGLVCDLIDTQDVIMTEAAQKERKWQIAAVTMNTAQSISLFSVRILNGVKNAEKTLKIASDATKSSLNFATQMIGGVGMVTEAASFGYAYNRLKNSKAEAEKLNSAKREKELRRLTQGGPLSENDRRADVLDNILTRKNESKRRTAMIDMVGSAISFAGNTIQVLGPASIFGMVVSLIGTGVKVIGTLWNLVETIKSKSKVVNEFFGIDELYEKVKPKLPAPTMKASKFEKKVKDELRHMVLAKLNLFSVDQGYYFAIRKMAELLYYKAFFKEDRTTPLQRKDIDDPKYDYVRKEYIPRIESLGLQPRYPNAEEAKDYEPPITIEMLMVKLK